MSDQQVKFRSDMQVELLDCDFPDCGRPRHSQGYCSSHYAQLMYGDGLTPIEFRRGRNEKVADAIARRSHMDSGCVIWDGSRNDRGYAIGGLRYGTRRLHRQLYIEERGEIPGGLVVDHTCGRGSDGCVTLSHLEAVTQAVNIQRAKTPASNTSGFRGVSFSRSANKWVAYANRNNKRTTFGYYERLEDAAIAAERGREMLDAMGVSND